MPGGNLSDKTPSFENDVRLPVENRTEARRRRPRRRGGNSNETCCECFAAIPPSVNGGPALLRETCTFGALGCGRFLPKATGKLGDVFAEELQHRSKRSVCARAKRR